MAKSVSYMLSMLPDVLFKDPQPVGSYLDTAFKLLKLKFNVKSPIYGSADITNRCNLKCKHCYWWKNRQQHDELTPEQWRHIIREKFKKAKVLQVALTGGEPLLRPDVIEVFEEEMKNRVTVITNGTMPLIDFGGVYYVSIDGTEKIHNNIRGLDIYNKVKENVISYDNKVLMNMTINSLNYGCIEDVVEEWKEIVHMINFQFYTPFIYDDSLWVPYGKKRDAVIERILKLKEEYPNLLLNTRMQLDLLRSNKWTKDCPRWAFLSFNDLGELKHPCFIGGKNKPLCERCGMCEATGMYTGLYQADFEWFKVYRDIVRIHS